MPTIVVDGPPLQDIELKRKLVKEITNIATSIYRIEHIVVLIRENAPDNVGVNGELIFDKKKGRNEDEK